LPQLKVDRGETWDDQTHVLAPPAASSNVATVPRLADPLAPRRSQAGKTAVVIDLGELTFPRLHGA